MEVKSATMMNLMLKQAIDVNMMQKKMQNDVQSMQGVMDMAKDVAQMTGKGTQLDLKG